MVKVTGIDIGRSSIHLVELEGSGRKYRLTKVASVARPASAPRPETDEAPPPEDPRILIDDLKAAFQTESIGKDRSVLAVSGARCILRSITLPFKGRDEIRKVLKFEAESYIHSHSIDDVVVDATLIEEHAEGTELFMAACPKPALDVDLKALHKIGVDPERADLAASLVVEAASSLGVFDATEEGPAIDLLLDLGARSVQMVLVRDGKLWTARALRWGAERIEMVLAQMLSVTPAEMAAALSERWGRTPVVAAVEGTEDEAAAPPAYSDVPIHVTDDDLRATMADLSERIGREVTRFLSGFDLARVPRRILLTGGGARLPGVAEALAAELDLPVELLDLLGRAGEEGGRPELDTAFAASLAAIGATRTTFNFRQEELAFRPKFDRLKFPLAVCLMVVTLLAFLVHVKLRQKIRQNEVAIGVVVVDAKRSGAAASRRLPDYTGLLFQVAHPVKTSSYLQLYLDGSDAGRQAAQRILETLPSQDVYRRTDYILAELNKIKRDLERDTGYFPEVNLESGLAVLQAFSAAIEKADDDKANPDIGRFVIPNIELQVGTNKRNPGHLKFRVAFRGQDFREQNAAFKRVMGAACGPGGPFEAFEQEGNEVIYTSVLNPGAEYPYKFVLQDEIPVFQDEKSN